MSEWKPIELPRSVLEVLADLTVRLCTARPEEDPAALWANLIEATWPALNAPLINIDASSTVLDSSSIYKTLNVSDPK